MTYDGAGTIPESWAADLTLSEVESRYDGPIPPAVLAMCRRQERRTIARTRVRITVKPAVVIERMATAMAELASAFGSATDEGLRRMGFTAGQIARFGAAAAEQAALQVAPEPDGERRSPPEDRLADQAEDRPEAA